jgi:hypothetical protein
MLNERDLDNLRKQREELRALNPALFERVNEILFRHDPIGINFGDNTDEYEAEVGTILGRLPGAQFAEDVRKIVHEEFIAWFCEAAGAEDRYTGIAEEIWVAYSG